MSGSQPETNAYRDNGKTAKTYKLRYLENDPNNKDITRFKIYFSKNVNISKLNLHNLTLFVPFEQATYTDISLQTTRNKIHKERHPRQPPRWQMDHDQAYR